MAGEQRLQGHFPRLGVLVSLGGATSVPLHMLWGSVDLALADDFLYSTSLEFVYVNSMKRVHVFQQ